MSTAPKGSRAVSHGRSTRDGIMLIDKEPGPSSFGVVECIKNLTGARKAGHAGTLDPFATGLLIVLLDQGTKLSPFLMSQDKLYRAALRLGVETDTGDVTGTIIEERDVGSFTATTIEEKIQDLVGRIKQIPPRYSAVHHQGKRAYELARKGVEFMPQEREVRVDYITVLSIEIPVVWIEVGCSSGTYIRSLASELGRRLGTGAHLASLRRMRSGPFHVDRSYTIEQVSRHLDNDAIKEVLIPLNEAAEGMKEVEVPSTLARKIRNGYRPQRGELAGECISLHRAECYYKAVKEGELIAILPASNNGNEVRRVFT